MNEIFDLIVIGGGINGAGIAADAAGRGLKVMLCEQNDLASATSSNSSKLIHGGLRYLEHYEFGLVSKALSEREILLKKAPHIIKPLTFRLPHQPHLRPSWMIRVGLFLYDHLAKRVTLNPSKSIRFLEDSPLVPDIVNGFEYSDGWVDDARLVVLNALVAKQYGAVIKTQTKCTGANRVENYWLVTFEDRATDLTYRVKSRGIVNAAGPWVARFFADGLGVKSPRNIRLIKGSHIVVPRIYEQEHAYMLQNEDRRIIFVIPYEGEFSLIGTTDIEIEGDPAKVEIDQTEIDYLIGVTNHYFKKKIKASDIVKTFSGVRPLLDDESESPQSINRDYTLDLDTQDGELPLLSVFGGKITTYRQLAETAVDKLSPFYRLMGEKWTKEFPLPGGNFTNKKALTCQFINNYPWLRKSLIERFVRSYGTLAESFLSNVKNTEEMGFYFGAGLYEVEVNYLIDHEWACSVDDIVWRRTKLGLFLSEAEINQLAEFLEKRKALIAA